jgi:hypothetical protein
LATSETNIAIGHSLYELGVTGLIMCINPYKLSIQSSKSLDDSGSSSPGWDTCQDMPSGPCEVPGMGISSKWKVRIVSIHLLIAVLGLRSGLASMPLM